MLWTLEQVNDLREHETGEAEVMETGQPLRPSLEIPGNGDYTTETQALLNPSCDSSEEHEIVREHAEHEFPHLRGRAAGGEGA